MHAYIASARGGEQRIDSIIIYVVDVFIASKDVDSIQKVSDHISKHLDIRNLGEVRQYLRIDFHQEGDFIKSNQS